MTGGINEQRGEAFYKDWYKTGGWKYSVWKEFWWHRCHVVKRFGLKLSRVELLHLCRQQGWEVQLELENGWSSNAQYMVRTRERAPLPRRPSSQFPRKER